MKKTLIDLWYGNLTPNTSNNIHASEITRLTDYVERHQQEQKKAGHGRREKLRKAPAML